jgi:mannose-1-phosphate guanylyltransferase/mannose-6-phosphate isomerase
LPIIICSDTHHFLVAEQLRQEDIQHGGILLEPMGRNTAPAIALAALHASLNGEDPILLVLAADHLIGDKIAFHQAIGEAEILAKQGKMVTFGIIPDLAHTSYGYIRRGDALAVDSTGYAVAEFVEKPDLATSQTYVDSAEYYWNGGMFMFKASKYLQELEKYAPQMLAICKEAIATETPDLDFVRVDTEIFATCPVDSIDYAVMEKTDAPIFVELTSNSQLLRT